MSRIATGDRPLVMKPSNNVYTVLAVVATLVNIICFLLLVVRFTAVFGASANLFSPH
jgi:hypothetical protein